MYVAQDLQHGEPEFDDTEKIEIRRLPFDEALRMVMEGEIIDGLSVAGVLKLASKRR